MATNNHEISLQQGIAMTTLYRVNRPSNFPICETFEVSAINKLLATEGCKYLRIYYGMTDELNANAILVAVNANDEDILPSGTSNSTDADDDGPVIIEDGYRCPPDCPPASPLNGA
ncbi:hypothetical protein [Parafilimonas sp.]|uniref:hypothetical protein n=1 Tax=Parafilimonas sp. TaxID=1969739 RepID=UPI0039E3B35C